MSVRRLDPVQPASFAFTAENIAWAKTLVSKYPAGKQASAVIPLLWRAQEQHDGWVSRAAIECVARMLDMAYIRVLEVATFYTMFQLSPVGKKAHIQVCGTTPCMLRGAEDLIKVCQRKIHHDPHHLNADGSMSWEEVECLGACVNAPMVQVFKDTYEDLTPQKLEALIDDWQAGRKTQVGPQNGRTNSMALSGATSLTDKTLYNKQRNFKRVEAPPPPAAPVAAAAAAPVAAPIAAGVATAPKPTVKREPRPRAERIPDPPKPVLKSSARAIDGRPELLKKPQGRADDLKLIWGVGPALEKLLNKLGVWHFDQIANWNAKELAWVDDKLEGFKGRGLRDEWIKQSKKLATGWRPDNAIGEKPKGKK
jgi:NADH-quinone oxidoreductase subunit E